LLLAPLEHLRAKLGRGQDLARGEGFAVADPAPLLDAVDRQGERPAARRNEHVLEHDAVLLAALQYLAGEQQHVHRAAILDHQRGHGRLVALGDLELAAGARLVERADGERRRAPRAVEPEDREPAVRAVLADADALEKTPEVAPDGAAAGRRLAGAHLRENPNPVGSRWPRDGNTRSQGQHVQEASSGHAPTLPAESGRARCSVAGVRQARRARVPEGWGCLARRTARCDNRCYAPNDRGAVSCARCGPSRGWSPAG